MSENVMISYRGAKYAIGQGSQFYGIWDVTALQSQPLEWWHKTPEGWAAAWARFASVEVPGTIAPVSSPTFAPGGASSTAVSSRRPLIAAVLLAAGVVLGVVGLFPDYLAGSSLVQQAYNLVPHVIYLGAWTASAVLILLGGARLRAGSLLGVGLSVVTFGLFLADAGTPITDGAHAAGPGLTLSLLGWLACAIGSAMAFRIGPANRLRAPFGHDMVPLIMIIIAALGTAIAFAPSWDSYALHTLTGFSQTITAGNAFANPAAVMAGDVAVMVAVFGVVAVAAFWRPVRLGSALAAGAIIPMLAQGISALILARQPVSPTQFGISPAQAAGLGLTIHSGLTAIFWVFCAFVAILMLLCGWMIISPAAEAPIHGDWLPAGNPDVGAHGYAASAVASDGNFAPVSQTPGAHAPAAGSTPAAQQ